MLTLGKVVLQDPTSATVQVAIEISSIRTDVPKRMTNQERMLLMDNMYLYEGG